MSHAARKFSKKQFEDFFRGYVDAALWSSTDESDERGGEPMDKNYSRSDIAPSSLRAMKRDCAKFFKQNRRDLDLYCEHVDRRGDSAPCMSFAGHDLWLTANGHGAGFWDRDGVGESGRGDAPEGLGERLSEASKKFASDLYVGDDGQVYVSPER